MEEKNKEEGEDEDKQEQLDDKIRTTMQSSIAMQQSCTQGPRQLFPLNKVEEEKKRRRTIERRKQEEKGGGGG